MLQRSYNILFGWIFFFAPLCDKIYLLRCWMMVFVHASDHNENHKNKLTWNKYDMLIKLIKLNPSKYISLQEIASVSLVA